jgi:hypothetical protein
VNSFAATAAFLVVACALAPTASAADPAVTDIKPFTLHPGVNTVPGFGVNGETFTIVQAWRGNGNAHGYNVWLVMSPKAEDQPFGVTGLAFNETDVPRDVIRDDPFDGERRLGSIRFARARVDGMPQTILIAADLDYDSGRPLADHETATIRIYKLTRSEGEVGGQPDIFVQAAVLKTTERYCNVEYAVRDRLHLPVDESMQGKDGCF